MSTLSDVLSSIALETHLSTFEEEELTLETLTWMAKDENVPAAQKMLLARSKANSYDYSISKLERIFI